MSTEYALTLADQKAAEAANAVSCSSNGQHAYLKALAKTPLAISELGRPRGRDHIHLSQVDGTDFVSWMGRCSDGYHRRIGRWMQLVRIGEPSDA